MTTTLPGGWALRRLRGPAGDLHAEPIPAAPHRAVWVLEATAPALVLGSTQGDDLVDAAAAARTGVAVVRRRSGGGVVYVDPATTAWVDVVLPAGDPLWDDDVGRAARWVGQAWQRALADLGVGPAVVHDGAMACGPLGRRVGFGTVGAGEVTPPDGRQIVGISQRRTRPAARPGGGRDPARPRGGAAWGDALWGGGWWGTVPRSGARWSSRGRPWGRRHDRRERGRDHCARRGAPLLHRHLRALGRRQEPA